ncbi:PhzF family phenazine biosynthesis protein, partial [Burkholderia sp. L27(2015)]|uniref:PhzF family phenazine biosynthesis protein n=1 Tax=Burkholderia sp. L27(2015) TaxID=1641858 RepID=UPI0020B16233
MEGAEKMQGVGENARRGTRGGPVGDCRVDVVKVFSAGPGGGNPAPIVLDASQLDAAQMQQVAAAYGHESGFVLPAQDPNNDFRFRFFVPNHEMEMCGHATVGALWLLRRNGLWTTPRARVETMSGLVNAVASVVARPVASQVASAERIEVSQPEGVVYPLTDTAIIDTLMKVLNLRPGDIMPLSVLNSKTSRIKTLIALRSPDVLHALKPDFASVEAVCAALDSTGLYPFAVEDSKRHIFHARQFPRSSGYHEDAATGIAATALLYGLRHYGFSPAAG